MTTSLEDNPFIGRIDIDNLTSAIRALNISVTRANEQYQRHLDMQRVQTDLQRQQTELQRQQMDILREICTHAASFRDMHESMLRLRADLESASANGSGG